MIFEEEEVSTLEEVRAYVGRRATAAITEQGKERDSGPRKEFLGLSS